MNTLKIECTKDDYIIKTAKASSENELKVEIPEEWDCDYVNVVLWEDDICEILENNDEQMLLVPKCGELLLRRMMYGEEMPFVTVPLRYEDQEILVLKV